MTREITLKISDKTAERIAAAAIMHKMTLQEYMMHMLGYMLWIEDQKFAGSRFQFIDKNGKKFAVEL